MKSVFKYTAHVPCVSETYRFVTFLKTKILLFVKQCPFSFTPGNG